MSEETDRFFSDRGGAEPDRVNGRYQLPDPETGEVRSFTSASNYGFPLVDQYGLTRWRHRQILIGLCARPDLIELLRVLTDPAGDVGKLDEIVSTALTAAGTTEAANKGTVLHEVARAVHAGRPYPPEYETFAQSYRAALARYGLRVVVAERQVINPAIGAAGQTDGILEEVDGSLVIADIKSTGRLDLAKHEISVQLAVYQGSSHIRDEAGRWVRIKPGQLRADYAVVIHVDRDTGAVSLYTVDLQVGRHGANLAEQVRGWRKSGPVLLPYVPPMTGGKTVSRAIVEENPANALQWTWYPPPAPAAGGIALTDASGAEAEPAPPADGSTRTVDGQQQVFQLGEWMDLPTVGDMVQEEIDQATAALTKTWGNEGAGEPLTDGTATLSNPNTLVTLRTAADLLQPKVTKAEVQQYALQHGLTDLAHTKKVLVEMLGKAGKLAAGNGVPTTVPAGKDPAVLTGAEPGLSDPTDPRDPAFRTAALSKISAAATVGDLGRVWAYVRRQGGDQAWSDEMAAAAKTQAALLDANMRAADAYPEAEALALIRAANSSNDLAEAWFEVTIGGSAPDRWTQEINDRALERMAQIEAATPPAPANPFVGAS